MANQQSARVALLHLRSWRAHRMLTLVQLGEAAGLSKMALQRLETGQAQANPLTVVKLARALGITKKQLIEEEPPEETRDDHQHVEVGQKDGRAVA